MRTSSQSARRVGILGAGYIAEFHARALQAVAGVELSAVCDLRKERAQRLARSFAIPQVFERFEDMLEKAELHAVHVLLPPDLHFDHVKKILEAGVHAFVEKPLCEQPKEADQLMALAAENGLRLGVGHNFLFSPVYERLRADAKAGRLGRLDDLEIVWHKALPQRLGSGGIWMLRRPGNIMLEIGPHQFAFLLDLIGSPNDLQVRAENPVLLADGNLFYRRWRITGCRDGTAFGMRFAFGAGFTEHRVHVRGTLAAATADFEANTYLLHHHSPHALDFDRFHRSVSESMQRLTQGIGTVLRYAAGKAGLKRFAGPYPASIMRCVRSFYFDPGGPVDPRLSAELGRATISLGRRIVELSGVSDVPAPAEQPKRPAATSGPKVLVIGGAGFIGRALVEKLVAYAASVRLLVRGSVSRSLAASTLEIVHGDFTSDDAIERALDRVEVVYHLARGFGPSKSEYEEQDIAPTRRLAEACLRHGVRRLIYTSSIAIYYAGRPEDTITEETTSHPGVLRTNNYAHTKARCERLLLEMHRNKGLPVVITRPGIVIGRGGKPLHGGLGQWHHDSVFEPFGPGDTPLPIVLVGDLTDALVRCLEAPDIDGDTFNLVGPPVLTADEYLQELERHASMCFKRYTRPTWVTYTVAIGKWLVKMAVGSGNRAFPSYRALEGRSAAARFDCSKAKRLLGWEPTAERRILIEEGIHIPANEFLMT